MLFCLVDMTIAKMILLGLIKGDLGQELKFWRSTTTAKDIVKIFFFFQNKTQNINLNLWKYNILFSRHVINHVIFI